MLRGSMLPVRVASFNEKRRAWVFNLFLFLVVAWWIFYRWRNIEQWTYFLFLVRLSPTILYLAAMVLFSPEGGSVQAPQDCRGHFYANRRSFFIFFGL